MPIRCQVECQMKTEETMLFYDGRLWDTIFSLKLRKKRGKKKKEMIVRNEWFQSPKITVQGNDYWFGQIWILCDAGVWHTRIFECSPIEWHSASSVFRTSPSESFTKIVRKYQTQKRTNSFGSTHSHENEAPFGVSFVHYSYIVKRICEFLFSFYLTRDMTYVDVDVLQ